MPPWKKGQSGNPSGRPRKLTNALDKVLTPVMTKKVAQSIVDKACEGDVYAFNAIADRLEGKVPQGVNVAGEDGGPLKIEVSINHIGGK